MFPTSVNKIMLNSHVVPSLELLSRDFQTIRLLRGFRSNTLEVK